ncbi:hypothetical protein E2562_017755, partial [Oryza meyeriana var. granulata]
MCKKQIIFNSKTTKADDRRIEEIKKSIGEAEIGPFTSYTTLMEQIISSQPTYCNSQNAQQQKKK